MTFVMQQLELLFCKYDLIYISTQHVQYYFTANTTDIPVDLTLYVITVESHTFQSKILGLLIRENYSWHVQILSLCANLSKIYFIVQSQRNVTGTQMIWSI